MNCNLLNSVFVAIQSIFEEPITLADVSIGGADWFSALEAMEDAILSGKTIEISNLFGDWAASVSIQVENGKITKIALHNSDGFDDSSLVYKIEDGVATLL